MSFWYLATPYSKFPRGLDAAYDVATRNASLLVAAGIQVFCPITYTHHISKQTIEMGMRLSHRFWLDFDRPFMEAARGIIVCKMTCWDISDGIREELEYFDSVKKPCVWMEPGIIPSELVK